MSCWGRWLSSSAKDYLTCWKKYTLCSLKWVAVTNWNIIWPFSDSLLHFMIWNIIIEWGLTISAYTLHLTFFFYQSVKGAVIRSWHLVLTVFSLTCVQSVRSVHILYVSVHNKSASWQEISGGQEGPQTNALCQGFLASWLLREGLGASPCDSAKKVSKATSATCSPPSETTLPVWEVREKDISREYYGYLYWDWGLSGCLQTADLSGWVILLQLMVHFSVMVTEAQILHTPVDMKDIYPQSAVLNFNLTWGKWFQEQASQ